MAAKTVGRLEIKGKVKKFKPRRNILGEILGSSMLLGYTM